ESYGYKLHEFKSQEEWLKVWRFSEWVKLVRPVNFASEVVVWDMVNRVAGSLDYLWYIKGGEYKVNGAKPIEIKEGFYVVDLKTGKVLDDDANVQVSKYREMLNILLDTGQLVFTHNGKTVSRVDGGIILHVNSSTRTGIQGVSTKVLENCNGDAHYFNNHLLPVWQRRNKDKQPKIFSMPTSIQLTDLIGE
ncbi:MAG: hypothetical protein GY841_06345, partial [FCB group bacterium]|nr:hypothetical protein [FCB group bacterium]